MDIKDLVLAIYEGGKSPLDIEGVKPLVSLDEIKKGTIVLFLKRKYMSITAYTVNKFEIQQDGKSIFIKEGILEIGSHDILRKGPYKADKLNIPLDLKPGNISEKRIHKEESYRFEL